MVILALPSGARVLDVPCGQGRHAHLLAEAGFRVDGLDYSAHLLARARDRGTGPTLRYTRGDMRQLPARWTGRFDAVVNLFTSFGFFTDPDDDARVVREFARVLAPRGEAYVQVPVLQGAAGRLQRALRTPLLRLARRPEHGAAFRGFRLTRRELDRALADAGLRVLGEDEGPSAYSHSRDRFLRLARAE